MAQPVINELNRKSTNCLPLIIGMIAAISAIWMAPALAEQSFIVGANIEVESGDTWTQNGTKYRLYGVQSCLRGTEFTTASSTEDCGLVSLSQFAALTQTANVTCQPVAPAKDGAIFVVCATKLAQPVLKEPNPNATIDIGTALIASGYAFAAVNRKGAPVNASYLVSELVAKKNRSGLWAGGFIHPVQFLLNGAKQ